MHTKPQRPDRQHFRLRSVLVTVGIFVLISSYVAIAVWRPFAKLKPTVASSTLQVTTPMSSLPWPTYGQAAFGTSDGHVVASRGDQVPIPTASTAKLITALCVLQKHPLALGESGPTITLSDADVALYNKYVAVDGSVVGVYSGEQISERQALEAMLLPSANNIADSLATWAFGSIPAYITYANSFLQTNHLAGSHVGSDASGFLPDTTSTASDLVKLGALTMQNPTLAQVVAEPTATIPGVGLVYNVDTLLGQDGIVGIKTGNNDQDTGAFVGAVTTTIDGRTITLLSAIAGAPSLPQALSDSGNLLAATKSTVADTAIVHQGDVLGNYQLPNGSRLQAVASQDLIVLILRGSTITATIKLQAISYKTRAGNVVGSVSVPASTFADSTSVPITLVQAPTKPGILYRLLHP